MIQSSSDLLEFETLRSLLGRYVSSPLGKGELEAVEPAVDRVWIESALADAAEAVEYLRTSQSPQVAQRGAAISPRFDSIPDPSSAVALLRIGARRWMRGRYTISRNCWIRLPKYVRS